MVEMKLKEHKRNFLENCGFEQTYESEPRISKMDGKMYAMEKWSRYDKYNIHHLYIHFNEGDSNVCNLYLDSEDPIGDVFSERNLISEMKKRGFEEREVVK